MAYTIISHGPSRSFPSDDELAQSFLAGASNQADIIIHLGAVHEPEPAAQASVVLIELGSESLGVYTGENSGEEGSNWLGFCRYRNGDDPPSPLIELVRQPASDPAAIDAAREVFESAGLQVAVCADQPGRIIDRLVRPKYNAALRFLDEGLATAHDMDRTCRMGLGYPDGPIERLERGGLNHHYHVTQALFETFGTPAYAPARRAVVAYQRKKRST